MSPNIRNMHVYYTKNTRTLTKACFDHYKNLLPLTEQARLMSYKREQDRQAALLGKALLIFNMKERNIVVDWGQLSRNEYGKPYLNHTMPGIEFNISHSENYIVAAMANVPVGIDIEVIKTINITDFENCFSDQEWRMITDCDTPLQQFFTYWSIKEAVIKAAGKGLSIPLLTVHIREDKAYIGTAEYDFKKLDLDPAYSLVLASPAALQADLQPQDCTHFFDWH